MEGRDAASHATLAHGGVKLISRKQSVPHGLVGVLCNGCMPVQGCGWPDRIPRVSTSDSSRAQDHSGMRALRPLGSACDRFTKFGDHLTSVQRAGPAGWRERQLEHGAMLTRARCAALCHRGSHGAHDMQSQGAGWSSCSAAQPAATTGAGARREQGCAQSLGR